MKPKSTLVMTTNFYGTPQTKFNLQGSGMIKFPRIPVVKKGDKRNIYA